MKRPHPFQHLQNTIAVDIAAELQRAQVHGEEFASLHEAYSVILEELDELWEICRQKQGERNADAIYTELVQIATMAIKAIKSPKVFPS